MTQRTDPLPRSAAGVLLGFVLIASYFVLEQPALNGIFSIDQLLEPGSFQPSPLLIGMRAGLALTVALLVGWFCRRVAGNRRAAFVLTMIILIITGFTALIAVTVPRGNPVPRVGGESPETVQAQMQIQEPRALTLAIPILLAAGILLGNRRKHRPEIAGNRTTTEE